MSTAAPHELSKAGLRARGAYYTPSGAVDLMASWVMDHGSATVLEPSFGDGAFLRAIRSEGLRRGEVPNLVGAELNKTAFEHAARDLQGTLDAHFGDFLALEPRPVDSVIGNPPFVRLRHLNGALKLSATGAAEAALGKPMDPAGSTWMAFVLHATRFLARGGCLALVVPLEITHVRYARALWAFLGSHFGRVRLVRSYARMFPDLLQDVAILLCERRGDTTGEVEFQATRTLVNLDDASATSLISLSEIHGGDRAFTAALLPADVRDLIADKLTPATRAVKDLATVRIGYVAGDKTFFHPDDMTIRDFRLPTRSLIEVVTRTRALTGAGLFTDASRAAITKRLWLPNPSRLTQGERRYIEAGEESGVAKRYKCAIRSPWFVVPGVVAPDVIFSVFSNEPLLMINDGCLAASNSLLTATMREGESVDDLATGWFTSVTQLFVELEVHSLGGGVLIAVPNELGKVRIPQLNGTKAHLRALDHALQIADIEQARELGDQALLAQEIITEEDLQRIRQAIRLLREWRERPTRTR